MYQSTTHSATLADVYLRVRDIGEVKGIACCEKGERQIEVALLLCAASSGQFSFLRLGRFDRLIARYRVNIPSVDNSIAATFVQKDSRAF